MIDQLGEYFSFNDSYLMRSLGFTVSNYVDNLKYKDILKEYNPFKLSNEVLSQKGLIYMFSDYLDESVIKKNYKGESELVRDLQIGVISKCKKEELSIRYIKDNFGYRTILLNILKDEGRNRLNPIKKMDIIEKLRIMGVKELDLTDNEIINWIIKPLKNSLKLGSNKLGYFVIIDEEDLHASYMSHYQNYLGFRTTLEKHKLLSEYNLYIEEDFNLHI